MALIKRQTRLQQRSMTLEEASRQAAEMRKLKARSVQTYSAPKKDASTKVRVRKGYSLTRPA